MIRFEHDGTAFELTDEQYAKVMTARMKYGRVWVDCYDDGILIYDDSQDEELLLMPDIKWTEKDGIITNLALDKAYTKLLNGEQP